MSYLLGIDSGGTFTDFVAMDEKGSVTINKTSSTHENPAEAIRNGIDLISSNLGMTVKDFLRECQLIIIGTTVATNALIQHRFTKMGMLCTKGFRDILEIRGGHKEHRYDWRYRQPPLLVPRYRRLPVEERITADGEVYTPLKKDDVLENIGKFKKNGVKCVVVCFLWSFLNPVHEKMAGELVKQEMPDVEVCLSSEVLPEIGDYNRVSTTAVNAALLPVVKTYIEGVEQFLHSFGYRRQICYSQSNAGMTAGEMAKQKPINILNSGPAQGPAAGSYIGKLHGYKNVITCDMGGTSFDATVTEDGVVDTVRSYDVGGYRVAIPSVRVNTLGAGGGSIAYIDQSGLLHVGPESAEAVPGPACYCKGGVEPTVTDADVILGYFNPEVLLGGKFPINREVAIKAMEEKIAKPLGMSVEHASIGIYNLVNNNMMNGIREISIEQGRDPHDFVLTAGGGTSPAHIGKLAMGMEIRVVLIPKVSSVLCAFGSTLADIKHDYTASYVTKFDKLDVDRLNGLIGEMKAAGLKDLSLEGVRQDSAEINTTLYIRYVGQAWDCPVIISNSDKITKDGLLDIKELFHGVHKRLYTFDDRKSECELVTVGVTVLGRVVDFEPIRATCKEKEPSVDARLGERMAFFEEQNDYVKTPVFDGSKIEAGNVITGPAVVEELTTTILVLPEWRLELGGYGVYKMTSEK